jgi:chorismate--pyruvate lyase
LVVDIVFMPLCADDLFVYPGWCLAELLPCPPLWLPWLTSQGSLTRQLKAYKSGFVLQLLLEQKTVLPDALAKRWQTNVGVRREVLMSLDGKAAVFAQSWLPDTTLATLSPLAQLGEQPLGEYIFTQADLSRGTIEVACFPEGLAINEPAAQAELWGRRSYFSLQQHEFLVQEVFLTGWLEQ